MRRDRASQDVTPERLLTLLWSSPERLAAAAPYTREVVESGLAAGRLTIDPLDVEPLITLMPERTRHRDAPGSVAERAAADRGWQFGRVIVDEAQELSAMEWRMLMRHVAVTRATRRLGVIADGWLPDVLQRATDRTDLEPTRAQNSGLS